MRRNRALALIAAATTLLGAGDAGAASLFRTGQFHFRGGYFSGSFGNSRYSGGVSNMNTVELEFESLNSNRSGYAIRSTFAYNLSNATMPYFYIGVASRYYLWGASGLAMETADGGTAVSTMPKTRIYLGPDIGIAQIILSSVSEALSVNSTLLEVGGSLGGIFQLSRRVGLNVNLGFGTGFGFSTVAAGATLLRGFVGLTYSLGGGP